MPDSSCMGISSINGKYGPTTRSKIRPWSRIISLQYSCDVMLSHSKIWNNVMPMYIVPSYTSTPGPHLSRSEAHSCAQNVLLCNQNNIWIESLLTVKRDSLENITLVHCWRTELICSLGRLNLSSRWLEWSEMHQTDFFA